MWLELKIAAGLEEAEALSEALLAAGALAVTVEDRDAGTAAEQAQYGEPGEGETRAWRRNWVSALLPGDTDVVALLARLGLPPQVEHRLQTLAEQDWVRLTQAQFEPIRVDERLWIVPSWHAPPEPEAINIVLDPGLAFGTGSHPTTRLCLRWLLAELRGGETVLDYGCGSGILAIAAARLGAGRVVGVDIDAQALQSARDNAARNAVAAEFCLPEALPALAADVLVANILSNPLKALAPLFARYQQPGGRIALSGILSAQADAVLAAYAPWFALRVEAQEEGWCLLAGRRRGG
ncbi:MAG: 50S ribosomal protein L11 methyltransferase [Burkholderiales bacterium]|nr:50S ribosomal protein L11 methyltransferase [Burkholderiales bacterium]